ncbi:MAG: glycosyltransferase family 4 protein [Ruminococcus sp.]|nr:glycosyltransferase family 4 protein [Ruminococcus sp.]
MKIVHLCLANFLIDGYSYQENMLLKYHKAQGYEVEAIASLFTFDQDGKAVDYQGPLSYQNEYDIPVVRLLYKKPEKVYRILRRYQGFEKALRQSAPDILFIHEFQFLDIDVVVRYLKEHPQVKVFVDNHSDYQNSAQNVLSRVVLNGMIWKRCAKKIEPYTEKFYGVLPARVDFLTQMYGVKKEKCALLEMGIDDEAAERALRPEIREQRREAYGASDHSFVIVTGGKIDHNKPQVLDLMRAVKTLSDKRIMLVVFGSVVPELKEEFDSLLSENVRYIGWRKAEEIYEDFAAADLVAFPGLHSVLWEQAVGMGKPCVFKRISGFEHIDIGGNCLFFENDSVQEYVDKLKLAVENIDEIKKAALSDRRKVFSYSSIAKRALEG